jgi:hypothetical protein
MKTKSFIFLILLSIVSFKCFSQTDLSKALNNNVIRKYYSAEELLKIYNEWPEKFKKIYLFYTESYIIEARNNEYTQIIFTDSIKNNFDVSLYENNRKENERFERYYDKLGFNLVLLSNNEFQNLLNNYVLDNINTALPSGFPTNVNSPSYAADKQLWIDNNQAAYNEYLERCRRKLNFISQSEFNNLPTLKQNVILDNPDIYIIY